MSEGRDGTERIPTKINDAEAMVAYLHMRRFIYTIYVYILYVYIYLTRKTTSKKNEVYSRGTIKFSLRCYYISPKTKIMSVLTGSCSREELHKSENVKGKLLAPVPWHCSKAVGQPFMIRVAMSARAA